MADLLRRVLGYTELDTEQVFWRRSILFGGLTAFLVLALYHKGVPPIGQFVLGTLIAFVGFYFNNSYYAMHHMFRSHNLAKQTTWKLAENLNLQEEVSQDRWGSMW